MTRAPLSGITVVALEQAVSAPMCTRTLADFGARVIKVEHPNGGDFARHYDDVVNGLAAHFVWCNRNKESVTLDLKTTEGLDILHRLLDRADVLVSNLAPGSTGRLGITPADMEVRHPNVIAVEIDGYGPGGPLSHKRAYDLLIQAESGTCAVTGEAGAPAKPGPPVADITTGLQSALSIMALLYSRDTGRSVGGNGRRRQPVRHHDGRDGLPAHLHPALGHRPAAAGHELTGRCAVRVVSAPPTARRWCSARPTTANGSAWHEKSSAAQRLGRRRAVPNERRPGGEPGGARRGDRRLVRATRSRSRAEDGGCRGNRQLPLQPAERGGGAPAADRARPLARQSARRRATSRRCGRRR